VGAEEQLNLFSVLKVTVLAFGAGMWIEQVPVLMGVWRGLSQQGLWLAGPGLPQMWVGADFHVSESEACE